MVAKKKKTAVQLTDGGKSVMTVFWKRNKALKFNRRDYRTDANLIAKLYGVEAINSKLKALDRMTEFKPLISNPSEYRAKHHKIKEPIKSLAKEI